MHPNANANAVGQLTTELWPAVPNPMIQCAHNIGLANTAHAQIHKYSTYAQIRT